MDNKFQLWSPPLLDLSLDSFSKDLIQEFDKTRSTIQTPETGEEQLDQTKREVDSSSATLLISPNNNSSESTDNDQRIVNSSSTLSQQAAEEETDEEAHEEARVFELETTEQENEEKESSSTANLFRKSSTFLKKKLKSNRNSTTSISPSSIITATTTTTSAEISSIVSRQYPPKPLQYSPIVEPPTDDIKALGRKSNSMNGSSARHSCDSSNHVLTRTLTTTMDQPVYQTDIKPMTIAVAPTVVETPKAAEGETIKHNQIKSSTTAAGTNRAVTNAAPKRRSFFSLRFC